MHFQTLRALSDALHARKFSSVELTEHFLKRIAQHDARLNSFISVTTDSARKHAREADARLAKGEGHALTGIPIAQKDNFCTQKIKTSCGSRMLDNFIAPYEASVIEHFKQAGTVFLGKTNLDEFAMGSSNETSFYGPVKNPWDLTRVPGGSSGGSAAAVAGGLSPAATGTDTGGSIRQPAAFCNLTGLKPTYGRVSRYGMVAFASSLDQGGPLTRTAEDAALMLNVMAGFDPKDSTSVDMPVPDYTTTLEGSLEGLRIGLPKEYFGEGLHPGIAKQVEAATQEFERLGARVQSLQLPNTHQGIALYYLIASAECASNFARYDGIRYGYRCSNPQNLEDLYKRSRSEGLGPEVKRRILMGTCILSTGYYHEYYLKAQKVRTLLIQDFQKIFQKVDLLLGPVTPSPAFKLGEKTQDPIQMYLSDIYTVAVSLAGLPALALPAGFVEGLPVGMQLIGPVFSEARLLNAGHRYQQVTDWHLRTPEAFRAP